MAAQVGGSGITSMLLEPDSKQFHLMLENLWSSALAALTSVPLFVLCRQYEQFVTAGPNSGGDGGGGNKFGLKATADICWEDL